MLMLDYREQSDVDYFYFLDFFAVNYNMVGIFICTW